MLYIKGNIGGSSWATETPISAKALLELFNIPLPKEDEPKEFTRPSRYFQPDRFGQLPQGSGLLLPAVFIGSDANGDSIELRYVISQSGDGLSKKYSPHKVELFKTGPREMFTVSSNLELYAFFALNPKNESSPLKGFGETYYSNYDATAVAKANVALAEIAHAMREVIFNATDKSAKIILGGAVIAGVSNPDAPSLTGYQAKHRLLQLLDKDPIAFQNAWESESVRTKGYVSIAMADGILTSKPVAGDKLNWYLNGQPIATVLTELDQIVALTAWFTANAEARNSLVEKIGKIEVNAAPSQALVSLETEIPISNLSTAALVEKAISQSKVVVDFAKKKAILLDSDGKVVSEIAKIEAIHQWVDSVKAAVAADESIRKLIELQLTE